MPIMDGIAATIELRRRAVLTPIVGLTANADHETRDEAMKAGMNELLTKPIALAELRNALERNRYHRRRNSPKRISITVQ